MLTLSRLQLRVIRGRTEQPGTDVLAEDPSSFEMPCLGPIAQLESAEKSVPRSVPSVQFVTHVSEDSASPDVLSLLLKDPGELNCTSVEILVPHPFFAPPHWYIRMEDHTTSPWFFFQALENEVGWTRLGTCSSVSGPGNLVWWCFMCWCFSEYFGLKHSMKQAHGQDQKHNLPKLHKISMISLLFSAWFQLCKRLVNHKSKPNTNSWTSRFSKRLDKFLQDSTAAGETSLDEFHL